LTNARYEIRLIQQVEFGPKPRVGPVTIAHVTSWDAKNAVLRLLFDGDMPEEAYINTIWASDWLERWNRMETL